MMKCNHRAYAICPDREWCGSLQDAIFTEGSECDEFNQKVINAPPTNADRIRAMSDEELAQAIYQGISSDACDYCKENDHHCAGHTCQGKADAEVILEWLQQPAEEVQGDGE